MVSPLNTASKYGLKIASELAGLSKHKLIMAFAILVTLVFLTFVYLSSMNSYYSFYLVRCLHFAVAHAQYCLFVLLFADVVGTLGTCPCPSVPLGQGPGFRAPSDIVWLPLCFFLAA